MVVHGFHVVLDALGGVRRQRTFVHDLLLADLAPTRVHSRVVLAGGPAVQEVAGPHLVLQFGRIRDALHIRFRLRSRYKCSEL